MGYSPGTTTIRKRKVFSIRGYLWPEKFMNFVHPSGPRTRRNFRIWPKIGVTSDPLILEAKESEICTTSASLKPMSKDKDKDSDSECELIFLSPPEEEGQKDHPEQDQGASPKLCRSSRKRKSVQAAPEKMSKGSASKKKKSSPDPTKSMPRIPRTPVQDGPLAAETASQGSKQDGSKGEDNPRQQAPPSSIETLLLGMEDRLGSKIDTTNRKVDRALTLVAETNTALEDLELRVEATEAAIDAKLEDVEGRLRDQVQSQVKGMVVDQLRSAGFDPDLTAAGLSTIRTENSLRPSYAEATSAALTPILAQPMPRTKEERQEENFWTCRRSLRLWPVTDTTREALNTFLVDKLKLDATFVKEDLGGTSIRRQFQRKGGNRNEICVTFESKNARDAVQAKASSLANYREEAGMLLLIPDHLQKVFKALMAMAYDLKKKFPGLRRNVKFDEDEQAMKAAAEQPRSAGTRSLNASELSDLLGQE